MAYGENKPQRLTPPWQIEERPSGQIGGCFVVRTCKGQAVAWVYYEERDQFQMMEPKLNRDQARRVAANIAKLPGLLNARPTPPASGQAGSDRPSGRPSGRPTSSPR